MLRSIALLLIICCSCASAAQSVNDNFDVRRNTVIARGSLSLRAAPGTDAARIKTLPYGTTVHVLEEAACARDTIGVLSDGEEVVNYMTGDRYFGNLPIPGNWVHVVHAGDTGFVFDAYLFYANPSLRETPRSRVNFYDAAYAFDRFGTSVINHRYPHNYGLYGKAGKYELRKITLNSVVMTAEGGGSYLHTLPDEREHLHFIIQSVTPLAPTEFTGWGFGSYGTRAIAEVDSVAAVHGIALTALRQDTILYDEYRALGPERLLYTNMLGETQELPGGLAGIGDINGDGTADLMTYGSFEGGGEFTLWFSRIDEGGSRRYYPFAVYAFSCC